MCSLFLAVFIFRVRTQRSLYYSLPYTEQKISQPTITLLIIVSYFIGPSMCSPKEHKSKYLNTKEFVLLLAERA